MPILLICAAPLMAAPFVPTSDDQVLERLPFKPGDPIAREMGQMRTELQQNPFNLEVAVKLARRYYSMVGEEGDPRYLGYAQAALGPWWTIPEPPIEVQLLRASLRQFRHDFAGAVTDLSQVLQRNPHHSRARALRATIHIVQARYDLARTDCLALRGISSDLIATGCEAMVDGLTGKAGPAYLALKGALERMPQAPPDEKLWVLIRLAEIASRRGDVKAAEAHFRQALALGIVDTFLLAAYADFLLDQRRPEEVVALLKDKTRSDTLLLRLVLAERALNLPEAKDREAALAARYEAARVREDTAHQQEEAQFSLKVRKDAKSALALAQENWKVQLEPRDARIFLEAAIALSDFDAAQPVMQWIESSRIEDAYLAGLANKLKGMRK